jgi:hypothetical protein
MIVSDFLHFLFAEGIEIDAKGDELHLSFPSKNYILPKGIEDELTKYKEAIIKRLQQNKIMSANEWLVHAHGFFYTKQIKRNKEWLLQRLDRDHFHLSSYAKYADNSYESKYKILTFDEILIKFQGTQ